MQKKTELSNKQLFLLLGAAVFNFIVYNGGRALSANYIHRSFAIALDSKIPFISWTVWIYWGCFAFWIVNYYLGTRYDKGNGCSFIAAHYIGETACFLFFLFLPTSMLRPEITGNSVSDYLLKLTYRFDEANNLFPSIHCFAAWLSWIGVRKNRFVPDVYQTLSLIFAVSVCISTLTVKQHVIADVPAGILLAEGAYLVSRSLEQKLHN